MQTKQDLAARLTSDLLELSGDRHVALRLRRAGGGSNGSAQRRDAPTAAGFRRTDMLPGNIGLLDIASFLRPIEHRDAGRQQPSLFLSAI